jgi:hypothetical protein
LITNQNMYMNLKSLLLCCFVVLASLFAKANNGVEENTKRADIAGGVHNSDSKKPLSSVSVTAFHLATKKEKIVLTDADGKYIFDDLQPGTYKFVFTKNGYKKVTKEKVITRQDEGFQMDVEMTEHSSFDFMPGPFHFSEFD